MRARIEGATLPGLTITLTDDAGVAITDGLSYTWSCEGALKVRSGSAKTELWTKTTGITATASGATVAWLAADLGSFTAVGYRQTMYEVEFTATNGTNIAKFAQDVPIDPQIP